MIGISIHATEHKVELVFLYTYSYIDRHVLCSHIRPFTKMCTIIFKNLATQGIQLTQEILYVESKTFTSQALQAWRTARKNVEKTQIVTSLPGIVPISGKLIKEIRAG